MNEEIKSLNRIIEGIQIVLNERLSDIGTRVIINILIDTYLENHRGEKGLNHEIVKYLNDIKKYYKL